MELAATVADLEENDEGMVITVEVPQNTSVGRYVVDSCSGTQLSLDTPRSSGARKVSSASLRIGSGGWKLKYQDFLPERKTGGAGGNWETTETFNKLVDAANAWLKMNGDVQVKTCQTMTWMSHDVKNLGSGEVMFMSKSVAENTPTYFLRGLRLWLVPRLLNKPYTLCCTDFQPDSTDLSIPHLVSRINAKIDHKQLKGDVITVETVSIPVIEGNVDTRMTKWTETMDNDVPYVFHLRVFHVQEQTTGKLSAASESSSFQIGIKDIVPMATEDGYEGFEDLVERGNAWLKEQPEQQSTIVNMQSIIAQRDNDCHMATGSACFYETPGINSPNAVDFFRILRIVYVIRSSSGQLDLDVQPTVCPINYETFTPELVRLKESSPKERLEKMNETFSKVIAFLRNSGVDVISAEMVSNPVQLYSPDDATHQSDEIRFLLTIRVFISGQVNRLDGSVRSIKRASVASRTSRTSSRARNSPMGDMDHPGPIFLKNVVSRRFPYRWLILAVSAISCMTVIVVVSVVYANKT